MSRFHSAAAGIDHLDRLSRAASPVHRLNASVKAAGTAVFLVLTISFPSRDVSGLASFVLYPALMLTLSGTPLRPLLPRLAVALPFAAAGGIGNLLVMRETAFRIGGLAVSTGAVSCVSILLKTLLCVSAVLVLIAATPFTEICALLTGTPAIGVIGLQLVLTYRYIAVLLDEAGSMRTAYLLRAPAESAVRMRDMGSFLGQLLLRSVDRAERVYRAMKCRGFTGVYRTGASRPLAAADIAFLAAVPCALVCLRFFNLSLFIGLFIGRGLLRF
jgi:cobalt/nickel transport system permease protein